MNKIVVCIVLLLTFGCNNTQKDKETENAASEENELTVQEPEASQTSLFNVVFRDIEALDHFAGYQKKKATVLNVEENQWDYAFVELQNKNKHILVLEKIIDTGQSEMDYQVVDTIHFRTTENEFTSMGLCQLNETEDVSIFSIIEGSNNDPEADYYSSIQRAWKADLTTKKIEPMADTKGIRCLNEAFGL